MTIEMERSLIEKLKTLSPDQQRQVVELVDRLAGGHAEPSGAERARRHIWEEIVELSAQVPDDAWRLVPSDGSEQHDHYLYGSPKRKM